MCCKQRLSLGGEPCCVCLRGHENVLALHSPLELGLYTVASPPTAPQFLIQLEPKFLEHFVSYGVRLCQCVHLNFYVGHSFECIGLDILYVLIYDRLAIYPQSIQLGGAERWLKSTVSSAERIHMLRYCRFVVDLWTDCRIPYIPFFLLFSFQLKHPEGEENKHKLKLKRKVEAQTQTLQTQTQTRTRDQTQTKWDRWGISPNSNSL